jgi:hypothetical protein
MKYLIRSEHGELKVQSYAELRTLYQRQFISDEDEVRKEGSDRWVKAGKMPDLRAIRPRPFFDGFEFAWLVIAISIATLIVLLLRR